jgi:hypothetical protein
MNFLDITIGPNLIKKKNDVLDTDICILRWNLPYWAQWTEIVPNLF